MNEVIPKAIKDGFQNLGNEIHNSRNGIFCAELFHNPVHPFKEVRNTYTTY